MIDHRTYTDTYDLYRPTRARDAGGVDVLTYPGSATTSGLACLFVDKAPSFMLQSDHAGVDLDVVAHLRVPWDQTLRPSVEGDLGDHVVVTTRDDRRFAVGAVHDPVGKGLFRFALLREV